MQELITDSIQQSKIGGRTINPNHRTSIQGQRKRKPLEGIPAVTTEGKEEEEKDSPSGYRELRHHPSLSSGKLLSAIPLREPRPRKREESEPPFITLPLSPLYCSPVSSSPPSTRSAKTGYSRRGSPDSPVSSPLLSNTRTRGIQLRGNTSEIIIKK